MLSKLSPEKKLITAITDKLITAITARLDTVLTTQKVVLISSSDVKNLNATDDIWSNVDSFASFTVLIFAF